MHILYIDESGTHAEACYFVVAGLAVFEKDTYFLARSLNQIQEKYFPSTNQPISHIFFHASSLKAPENRVPEPFNTLTTEQRRNLVNDIYRVIAESNTRLFAVAMEKNNLAGSEPYEYGFTQIVSRFDQMLGRILRDRGEDNRGLIVIAESSYRENIELLAHKIATEGHRWGQIHALADIPYFAPARNTRLLQLADFVSHAVYARYESGYAKDFDIIASKFDQDQQGKIHGLLHHVRDRQNCYCLACSNRKIFPRIETDEFH